MRGTLRKENINPAEVMSTGAIWGWAVVVGGGGDMGEEEGVRTPPVMD